MSAKAFNTFKQERIHFITDLSVCETFTVCVPRQNQNIQKISVTFL